ncbi:hypothetical protein [Polyangium sorediatum]|uniref:Uncharacterized protein n=1 Tax=Polyangium sorediatum TaxID=889274 RepID=A0ABT6NMV3_9BACT|nr:hypothetical protein [Polyangium sorediatum]MDI1429634.1 hypothetical protein [Polyangium sorediatum]
MDVVLSKSWLRPLLFVPMGLVVLAGVLVEVLKPLYELPSRSGIVPFLSMSYEGNVPTFYTAALLGLTSLLLALAAAATRRAGERFVAHWWGLSAGFAYIAVDEVFEFHEMAGTFVELSGVLYFSWVIPAAVVVLLVGLVYVPFLRHLPLRTRIRFLVAGAIYVGGAVGMELPLGYWTEKKGMHNLGYGLLDAVEESLEMLGINLFVLWLVDHLAEKGVTLRFATPAPEAPAEPAPEAEAADAP